VYPIDPASGTVLVTDSREGLFEVFILETRGDEIAVLGGTITRATGQLGHSSTVETITGICIRI
jgi:hypothetical protein